MGKPLMDPKAFKALPYDQKQERVKEFYGSAFRDKCDNNNHTCQAPEKHQAAMNTVMSNAYSGTPHSMDDIHAYTEHEPPDYIGGATQVGGPLSDYHGYTDGKPNPNPWPAK